MEILITTTVFVALAGIGLVMSMDMYRGASFRSERDTAVSLFQKARSRALANRYQSPHGVCYDDASRSYIVFRGASYVAGSETNEITPAGPGVSLSSFPLCGAGEGVVFAQLTATTTGADIAIIQNAKSETISINHEGAIMW